MLSTVEECFEAIKNGWDFEVRIDGERLVSVQFWASNITVAEGLPHPEYIWQAAAETIMHHWTQEERIEEYGKWLSCQESQ